MKKTMQKMLLALLLSCCALLSYAQQRTVTGVVTDETGKPIAGATITIKGTLNATASDDAGAYAIEVTDNNTILVASSLGFESKEMTVGNNNTINFTLLTGGIKSEENVVVTALGIKRERRSLGYGVQEVKGQDLTDAREPNVTNALSGRVAGLQVARSSNGPAGSSRIILRGNNSLTGDNQPLIVVDGIPINNTSGAGVGKGINQGGVVPGATNDYWNPSLDMGNGLSDINPDDIASISVLKGPSAASLYGSRAGNGVILITTKTGKKQQGLGITVSSTVGFQSIFTNPDMQTTFGQGTTNTYNKTSALSWGPKIEGQDVESWNGNTVPLKYYDNIDRYFENGFSSNQSITFSQQYNSTSVYTSLNRLDDKSMIPGAKLGRTNLTTRATSKFGKDDRWTLDAKVQYINSKATNRPQAGNNSGNIYRLMYILPVSLDIEDFKGRTGDDGKMSWYIPNSTTVNPYWAQKNYLNSDIRNRYIMTGSLKYEFTDWLNAEIRAGSDMYNTTAENKTYAGSPLTTTGQYSIGKYSFSETNYSTLITARKDNIFGKLGGLATIGGNLMSQNINSIKTSSGDLVVPNLFSVNNGKNPASVDELYSNKKINSAYGSLQLNWDGYLFLETTLRNDWSSVLSENHRSYLYSSTNLSFVITDMIRQNGGSLPSWISFGKIRASAAQAGNDMGPYQLYNTYTIGKDANGNTTAKRNETLFDPNVRNELLKTYEIGAELRMLNNRLGLDFSWYKTNATNQLLAVPLDPLSGYTNKMINAGNIENKGIEVVVDAKILNNPNALNWNMQVNFSNNKNTVRSIAPDIELYSLGGYDAVTVYAEAGQLYGQIYGSKFARVEDPSSKFNGQLLLTSAGLPQGTDAQRLGQQTPDFLLGTTNTFSYKGLSLAFLLDGRFGGKIFSATLASMQRAGTAAETVVNGERPTMKVPGVIRNDNGEYVVNDKEITTQQYWQAVQSGNIGITEANLYDASNIRLRNLQLSYQLPNKVLGNSFVQRAKVGVSCNNVWLISSHMKGLDPESVFAVGSNAVGFENGAPPTSRYYMFNITLSF